MVKHHRVSIRGSYALTVKQFVTFLLGLTCALPAVSLADELDDVLNDLLSYRQGKRMEAIQSPFPTGTMSQDTSVKGNPKNDIKSAKASPQKAFKGSEEETSKSIATKK